MAPHPSKAWRGARAAALYYAVPALVGAAAYFVPGLWDGIFFVVLLPGVLLLGRLAWSVVALVTIRRAWSRGALAVHVVALPFFWLLPFGIRVG